MAGALTSATHFPSRAGWTRPATASWRSTSVARAAQRHLRGAGSRSAGTSPQPFAHARQRGAERTFLIGSSMGGAAIVQNTSAFRVDGRISLSGTRLWPGFGINDPAGLARIRDPFLYVGSRDDWRAPAGEARSIFRRVGATDKRMVLYPGSDHGWQLVETAPFAARARALVLRWIASH
jgi:pimeloyl-ACP methyl ester carboxylesterase